MTTKTLAIIAIIMICSSNLAVIIFNKRGRAKLSVVDGYTKGLGAFMFVGVNAATIIFLYCVFRQIA